MPSYYRPHQHPLTPPDYTSPFGIGPFGNKYGFESMFDGTALKNGDDAFASQQFSRDNSFGGPMLQPFTGAPPPGLTHPNSLNIHSGGGHNFPLPAPHPVHVPGALKFEPRPNTEQQRVQQPPQEEQRPVGGVAAKLDYTMENMVDFVAHMSSAIIEGYGQSAPVSSSFRKFVHQVLSSTRLPRATILLGLEYLSTRCATEGVMNGSPRSQIYRMLTIALLLASKFLDDNTFQNRSWAEVTGIPGPELNQMEAEWLIGMNWRLHVQPDAPKGFFRWEAMYLKWTESRETKRTQDHASLPPINTHVANPHTMKSSFSPLYPPHNPPPIGFAADRSRSIDQTATGWWTAPGLSTPGENNSPSAPETGPTTPDHFGRVPWEHAFGPQAARPHGMAPLPQQAQYGAFHPQTAMQSHNPYVQQLAVHQHQHHQQMMWNGQQCQCNPCVTRHNESLFINSYGGRGQVVVG